MTALLRDLTARGLLSAPSPKRPSRPLGGKNALYRVLTNPYYAGGVIRYKGALHPGAHEPIVEPALFDQVQSLLRARTAKQTRHVQHAHHLKGLLHCGTCAHGCCSTSPPTPGHDLRILRLLRPRRQEDDLHPAGGARRGRRASRRGFLRLDHDQRSDLPRPRQAGGCGVRQAHVRPRPGNRRPHGKPSQARSRE